MSYLTERSKQRLLQLNVKDSYSWEDNIVLLENDISNLQFWKTLPSKNLGFIEVPLDKVVGTAHIDYGGKRSWIENIACLKRFSSSYSEEVCSAYFESESIKYIYVNKYGDNYYISGDGNHRIHIAKFLGYKNLKIKTTEFFFDHEFYTVLEDYKKENLALTCDARDIYREAQFKISFSNYTYFIIGFEKLKEFLQLYKITKASYFNYLTQIKFSKEKIVCSPYVKDYCHINKKDDLNTIFKMLSALKYEHLNKKKRLLIK